MLAILHTAQYDAVQETLKAEGLTPEKARADPKALEKVAPALQAAVASAGEFISKSPYIACLILVLPFNFARYAISLLLV